MANPVFIEDSHLYLRLGGQAALTQLSRIWHEELREHGVRVLALDPGDMDTPLHALAVPNADPATLKPPAQAAREIVALIDGAQVSA